MNIVKRKLSELKQAEKNIRMHPDKQINEYIRSLEKNGQLKPIVIDENNVIWIGNGLYQAMTKAGYKEAYCLLKEGMTEKDKKKMMLSDNRIFARKRKPRLQLQKKPTKNKRRLLHSPHRTAHLSRNTLPLPKILRKRLADMLSARNVVRRYGCKKSAGENGCC